jgi:hypothetical protein
MNRIRSSWLLFAAAAIALSAVVASREFRARRQADELAAERQRHAELSRLLNENQGLKAQQLSGLERKRLELRHAEADSLRSRLVELQTRSAGEPAGAPAAADGIQNVPAADWVYAGREDPKATFESVLWAASGGDVEHLAELLGFAQNVRGQADAFFAQLPAASQEEFGSPERVVATLLAGGFPKDAAYLTVLQDHASDQDAYALVTVGHSDGQPRTNVYQFHRDADGWRLMVPASVLSGYQSILVGDAPSSETPAP